MTDNDTPTTDDNLGLTPVERERLGIPRGKARIENERGPDGELTARALAARIVSQQ